MAKPQSITSLPPSPDDDRRARMLRYTVAMSIRMLCLVACLFVPGWWIIIPALGAVLLPYIAVVLANVSISNSDGVEDPGSRAIVLRPGEGERE